MSAAAASMAGESREIERNAPYEGPGKLSGSAFAEERGVYELTVRDHFDAAHALIGYDGPCRFLHGHTWDVEVTIEGERLDDVGMLCDFKDVKGAIHAILDNFDHHCVNDVPPFDQVNPTAEHLARVVFCELEPRLPEGVALKEVAVWESPAARVAFRRQAAPRG